MLNESMAKSTTIVKQKKPMGRPVEIGADQFVGLRLPGALLARVDEWAANEEIARSEAMRRLIERGLKTKR
jgi:Ribbon-helix-helix protein, copG family